MKYISEGKIKDDAGIIEENFGGMLRLDLSIFSTDNSSLSNNEKMGEIQRFEDQLIEEKLYSGFISLNSIKNQIYEQAKSYLIINPGIKSKIIEDLRSEMQHKTGFFSLINDESTRTNLITNIGVNNTRNLKSNVNKINEIFHEIVPDSLNMGIKIQGYTPLYLKVNEYVQRSQLISFGAAFIIAFLFLFLMIGNIRLSLISIIPNLLPIGLMIATVALLGIELDFSTIMVAPIMLGIAIDDTIHLVHRYQDYRLKHVDKVTSINNAMIYVGKAAIVTSLALTIGFFVLALSELISIRLFGFLSGITVIFAFIADVILLPALIKVFDK